MGQRCAGHVTGDTGPEGTHPLDCSRSLNLCIGAFTLMQLALSQLKDFHDLWCAKPELPCVLTAGCCCKGSEDRVVELAWGHSVASTLSRPRGSMCDSSERGNAPVLTGVPGPEQRLMPLGAWCRWVSLIGAAMSACYSSIAAGASIAAVDGSASFAARRGASTADEFFGVLNAMGTVLFAFGGQAVIMEIQVCFGCATSPVQAVLAGRRESKQHCGLFQRIVTIALQCCPCSTASSLCSVHSCCCTQLLPDRVS